MINYRWKDGEYNGFYNCKCLKLEDKKMVKNGSIYYCTKLKKDVPGLMISVIDYYKDYGIKTY